MRNLGARQTNIEMLRIVSIFLIIAYHLSAHGVMHILMESDKYLLWYKGSLPNKVFSCILSPGGEVGVAIFFIISGYFCINKGRISILNVLMQTFFYGLFAIVLFVITDFGGAIHTEVGRSTIIKWLIKSVVIPISGGGYWFVTTYVFVMLLVPIVNPLLQKLSRKGFIKIILMTWTVWYVIASVGGIYFQLQKGLFFYSIGAFYRMHKKKNEKKWLCLILFSLFWIAGGAFSYGIGTISIMETPSMVQKAIFELLPILETGIIAPACAICLFAFFESINIGHIEFVNTVAATTFGVYLIHDSIVGRNMLWYNVFKVDMILYQSKWFPLLALGVTLIVFTGCTAVDYLRLRFIEPKAMEKTEKILKQIKKGLFEDDFH